MRRAAAILGSLIIGIVAVPCAQAPAVVPEPSFETASVKVNTSSARQSSMNPQIADRFIASNFPIQSLLSYAYQIPPGRLQGLPSTMATSRFDIDAKASGPATMADKALMVRRLLQDRFKLRMRIVVVEADGYALVVA